MRIGAAIIVVALAGVVVHPDAGWTPLWNGKDLDGWTTWMRQPETGSDAPGLKRGADGKYSEPIGAGRDPLNVFTVVTDVDGRPAIRISGEVFGELRTKASFKDYHLRLQFKWGEKRWPPRDQPGIPRDSGLLYHVHAEPGAEGRTWARSIELQIQEHDVGDLYAVGSAIAVRATRRPGTEPALYDYDPQGEWTFFSQSQGSPGRCIKQPDNEKPTGEWNTVELIAFGDESIHIVNGKVVMRLHSPTRITGDTPSPVTSGPIILQSEGAEVFYRDIAVQPITAVPAEFVAR
jgi:3-keto-disaccharide hydrolase